MKITTKKGGKKEVGTQFTIAQKIKEPINLLYFLVFLCLVSFFVTV